MTRRQVTAVFIFRDRPCASVSVTVRASTAVVMAEPLRGGAGLFARPLSDFATLKLSH